MDTKESKGSNETGEDDVYNDDLLPVLLPQVHPPRYSQSCLSNVENHPATLCLQFPVAPVAYRLLSKFCCREPHAL